MIVSVLLNNYNYGRFVGAALESVLAQTRPAEEIIVVDDGSTDDSLAVLDAFQGRHPALRIIAKANAGQLSCFNVAVAAATGDLLFFLDADDEYAPTYLERALAVYRARPNCGFLYCTGQMFGRVDGLYQRYPESYDLELTMALTRTRAAFYGSVNSTHSMRRELANRLLPLPLEKDWITSADTCLTWGSSLAGAGKCYLHEPLVRYRAHDDNRWYGRTFSKRDEYDYLLRINRVMRHYDRALGLPVDAHAYLAEEFLSKTRPRGSEAKAYLAAVWDHAAFSLWKRTRLSWRMIWHYLVTRRTPVAPVTGG